MPKAIAIIFNYTFLQNKSDKKKIYGSNITKSVTANITNWLTN